ncbi:hypothetical protein [Marinobacter xestospongiae]|uniref:Beta-barrel porin 2 n=1 Tax=Marinobacter xestospongiae TaxID=994319 RepID=A0ABU3VZK9_9GAMM|nr:hypothetical protein [Marinobacter xestospongiae]MDV2079720.1 hypothetical protein [Marinobacter xestospongiae]
MAGDVLWASVGRPLVLLVAASAVSTANADWLGERLNGYTVSASGFTAVSHTVTDRSAGKQYDTTPSIGVAGGLGADLAWGANSLSARYSANLESKRIDRKDSSSDTSYINGASRYAYYRPAGRFDFDLGHSVRSVRNDTGFLIDPANYDTRNTLSTGAGLRFFPGDLSTLRFFGRAGRSFEEGEREDTDSYSSGGEFSRRLSEDSSLSLSGQRSWSEEEGSDVTIDSASLGYRNNLEHGRFEFGVGLSQADVEYTSGGDTDSDAVTGYLRRSWVSEESTTGVSYNRNMSSTALDLVLDLGLPSEFDPFTVRVTELNVQDQLEIFHSSSAFCGGCSFGVVAGGTRQESQTTDLRTYQYRAGVRFGFPVAHLQDVNLSYNWSGDAGDDSGDIEDQIHRLSVNWRRYVGEATTVGVRVTQSYLRRDASADPDQERLYVRLSITHELNATSR